MRIFVHCIDSRTETFAFIYGLRLLVRLITKFTSTSIQVYTTCEYNKRKQHRLTPPSNKTMSMMLRLRWDGRLNVRRVPAALVGEPRNNNNKGAHMCTKALQIFAQVHRCHSRHLSRLEGNTRTSSLAMHSRWHSVTYVVFSPNSRRSTLLSALPSISRFSLPNNFSVQFLRHSHFYEIFQKIKSIQPE